MPQRFIMTAIAASALLLSAPAQSETSADFLGSIFAGAAIGAVIDGGGGVSNSVVLRNGVVVERGTSGGGLREEVVLASDFFVGGLVRNGVGVDTAIQLAFGSPTDRLRINRLQDFERPISSSGVSARLERGRGYIASELRRRGRAGLLP